MNTLNLMTKMNEGQRVKAIMNVSKDKSNKNARTKLK